MNIEYQIFLEDIFSPGRTASQDYTLRFKEVFNWLKHFISILNCQTRQLYAQRNCKINFPKLECQDFLQP
jgi:hypothetical protein